MVSLPAGQAFLNEAVPVFEAYGRGDHSEAFAMFVAAASGLDWTTCRALLEQRIPGVVAQSIDDADTFFGIELPAIVEWEFGAEQAAAIQRPVLSMLGAETRPLWVEIADFLRASLPHVEESTIDGVGHLLQIQQPQPVARAMAKFLGRNPMAADDAQHFVSATHESHAGPRAFTPPRPGRLDVKRRPRPRSRGGESNPTADME